jgi:NNP family nitrate/nitrite transporter-like MFS transporter
MAKKMTGSYQIGFLGFAALAVFALVALHGLKARWRAVWPTLHGADARPIRV